MSIETLIAVTVTVVAMLAILFFQDWTNSRLQRASARLKQKAAEMNDLAEPLPEIERLHPDDLATVAERLAENIAKRHGSDAIDARVYRELAKRYREAIAATSPSTAD